MNGSRQQSFKCVSKIIHAAYALKKCITLAKLRRTLFHCGTDMCTATYACTRNVMKQVTKNP